MELCSIFLSQFIQQPFCLKYYDVPFLFILVHIISPLRFLMQFCSWRIFVPCYRKHREMHCLFFRSLFLVELCHALLSKYIILSLTCRLSTLDLFLIHNWSKIPISNGTFAPLAWRKKIWIKVFFLTWSMYRMGIIHPRINIKNT